MFVAADTTRTNDEKLNMSLRPIEFLILNYNRFITVLLRKYKPSRRFKFNKIKTVAKFGMGKNR